MQIILLERVEKLGKLGDVVTVKPDMRGTIFYRRAKLYVRTKRILKSLKLNVQNVKHATRMQKLLPKSKLGLWLA